jgi:ubiquinone/menaquinone biosynthesis C-methylase UbiE
MSGLSTSTSDLEKRSNETAAFSGAHGARNYLVVKVKQMIPQSAAGILPQREVELERFYEDAASLFVRAYDAFYGGGSAPPIVGDIAFYERLAREAGGAVLELACGTGRIALALAESGVLVTGVDISDGMLAVARRNSERMSPAARNRLTLVEHDMRRLRIGGEFRLVVIAFRSFAHLLTIEEQRLTLQAARRHLQPQGRLALHLFDPRFDLLLDENPPAIRLTGTDPTTGRCFVGEITRTRRDYLNQIRRDLWRYTETDANGALLQEATRESALRWTYRWELRHLLELCGFAVEAEYSDFLGAPPVYGKELVVVARRVGSRTRQQINI